MAVKANGKEWKEYYVRDWQKGWWHDDSVITVDGKSDEDHPELDVNNVADTAAVMLEGGCIMEEEGALVAKSMEAHFKAWRKAQSHTSFVVECHKDAREAVEAAIKAAGGKVL